jgi:hypothetical protein
MPEEKLIEKLEMDDKGRLTIILNRPPLNSKDLDRLDAAIESAYYQYQQKKNPQKREESVWY